MSWEKEKKGRAWVEVPMKVVGKDRPRFDPIRKRTYTSRQTESAQNLIRNRWASVYGQKWADWKDEVWVEVIESRPLPASYPLKRSGEPDIYKPDLDNVVKLALDAISGIAFHDDCQITKISAQKSRRFKGEVESITITVTYVENEESK